jgi:RHS repeat-associated protein
LLGSTVATADTSTVNGEYSYDPFGGTTLSGDDGGNPTRFTGREDDGSGLYYYRSRYYSTTTGQFLSRDPLGLASGSTNPYQYVLNQPTGLVDPMGTKPQDGDGGDGGGGSHNITVAWKPGMPKVEFMRKAADLQRLSDAGLLFKAPNPVARDSSVTRNYKADLIRRSFDQYGKSNPDFASALRNRILTRMDPDHVWELQVGGPDSASNLRMLDRFTNQDIGMRQIWPQIRSLPDYTPITITIQGP